MRRLECLMVTMVMFVLMLLPVDGFTQSDPAAKSMGLTPDAGSLPVWTKVNPNARQELGHVARAQEAGIFLVGHPKVGTGTAWVISKKHRLLATNAHVADIRFNAGGKMLAIPSGSTQLYVVEKVWYHPGVRRYYKNDINASITSLNPAEGSIDPQSPDLAVLQLSSEGPDLPAEFTMATPDDLNQLFAQEVAIIGFPSHDTAGWPAVGETARITYHDGVVSRITDFRLSPNASAGELQYVQYTMATWPGFSGSPVFLANGRVAAIHNMGRTIKSSKGEIRSIPYGVRVDSLWELLVHHKLDDKVALKIDRSQVLLDRWLKPDEKSEKIRKDYARAVAVVAEAYHLVYVLEKYTDGVDKCNEAIALMPSYPRAYMVRSGGFTNYWFDFRRKVPYQDGLKALEAALRDATTYAQLAPSDPEGDVQVCRVLNNIGTFTKDYSFNRKALGHLDKLLHGENLRKYTRADALSTRGVSYSNLGEREAALRDHNAAIQLAPYEPVFYETRADFWRGQSRRNLEQADYAKARELRQKRVGK